VKELTINITKDTFGWWSYDSLELRYLDSSGVKRFNFDVIWDYECNFFFILFNIKNIINCGSFNTMIVW